MSMIDLSRLPLPAAIETLDYEALFDGFAERFLARWNAARLADPTLPEFDVGPLQTNVPAIVGQAWSELRLLDRQRVNDAVAAVLATMARGADLDNIVTRVNITRADGESDAALLRRYLLSFDMPSAGSADAYLARAYAAWPTMHHAVVIGRAIHGRRGDVDLVISGPGGDQPTTQQLAAVRSAVTAPAAKPEATSVSVLGARRTVYAVSLVVEVPKGPDENLVRAEVQARVLAAAAERNLIGAGIPADRLAAAAYGPNVLTVRCRAPAVDIVADAYAIPVCGSLAIEVEVV